MRHSRRLPLAVRSHWRTRAAWPQPAPLHPAGRRTYLLKKGAAQRASGHELLEGDVEWTPGSTLLYPALCSFAGLAAGIFGVGGGIIKARWLAVRENPAVCARHGRWKAVGMLLSRKRGLVHARSLPVPQPSHPCRAR